MNATKDVKCIETLTINDQIEVMRITTEDDEQIIGLPMFTSEKSGGVLTKLNTIMLYVPQEQTVMNIVDVETTDGSLCSIEPSGKHLIQPEMQYFWGVNGERIVKLFNQKSQL